MVNIGFLKVGLCVLLFSACQPSAVKVDNNNNSHAKTSTIDIDLENRISFSLPKELEEISGHTFLPNNDSIVYCIQDENGIVYGYDLNTEKISQRLAFGKDGDYEGITNDGKHFYVLRSDGTIYSFPISGGSQADNPKVFENLLGKGEYESLGIDTAKKQLIVLCKSCKVDKGNRQSTGYILDYNEHGSITLANSFTINLHDVSKIAPKFPKTFNPSAITRKVSSNEWYILSSIDKVMLITNATFSPVAVIPFSRKLYEQPEGIAFDSQGDLYISSERRDRASAMLYKIK